MAEGTEGPTKTKSKVEEAEDFAPAIEERSSSRLADQFSDLLNQARTDYMNRDKTKPNDNYQYNQGKLPGDKGEPGDIAAQSLQKLFAKGKDAAPPAEKDNPPAKDAEKPESWENGKGNFRELTVGDKPSGQYVDSTGKTTTRIDENTAIEYDPKSQKYSKIDKDGKRTELDPNTSTEKFAGKTLKEMIESGVASQKSEDGKSEKTSFLDGKVKTTFAEGELAERVTYPPGQKDGLRQTEKFREKAPGDTSETSARTVEKYGDKTVTSFDKGDISKVTAFKEPSKDQPAVRTEYRSNGPNGATEVDTYRNDGSPNGIKQIAKFGEGKPDQVTTNDGRTFAKPENGDIRKPVGQGDTAGVVDINKETGMPTHMKIGDRDYKVEYGPDGKIKSFTGEKPGDPPSKIELERGPDGKLVVKSATGDFVDKETGKPKLEGLPIETQKVVEKDADGKDVEVTKVVGDVHLNKSGDLRYKTGEGPDRHEIVRRANGNIEDYNFKDWKKTVTGPDGKTISEQAWDGYNWRNFKESADGKRLEFVPADPKKPAFIERETQPGPPPTDKTSIGYADGSKLNCDWQNGTQTEIAKDGKQTVRHYDGSTYREGTVTDASKLNDPRTGEPLGKEGDKLVVFKEEPKLALKKADGSVITIYSPENQGDKPTVVEKDPAGRVKEVNGPKGVFQFKHDGDGDISQVTELEADGKTVKQVLTRQGEEKNPGMQEWTGREGANTPRQPADKPPRDPFKPNGYNSWAVTDGQGKPINGGKLENMNFNTTADGTIRTEKPGANGKVEVFNRAPRGDNFTETETQKVVDRGHGVRETIDKATGKQSFQFNRNGVDVTVPSPDAPKDTKVSLLPDGTVSEQSMVKDEKTGLVSGKTTYHLPDGSVTKMELAQVKDENGKPKFRQDGQPEMTGNITELQVAANDPTHPGALSEKLVVGQDGVKNIRLSRDGRLQVSTEKDGKESKATYDFNERSKSEQKPGENFYRTVSLKDGKPMGLNNSLNQPILRIDSDGKAKTIPTGKTLDPKDWNLSDIQKDKDGNAIIKSSKPGSTDQMLLKPNGSVVETIDGKNKVTYQDGMEASLKADGTIDSVKMGGKDYEPILDEGKVVGFKAKDGSGKIDALPPGTKYENKLSEDGLLVAENKDEKSGITSRISWAPSEGIYSVDKTWKSADGKDQIMSYVADANGNVSGFVVPPAPPGTPRADVKTLNAGQFPDLTAKVDKDGVLTVNINKDEKVVVNKDGSTDNTFKKQNGELKVFHRDRDGNAQATEKQAAVIRDLLKADLSKPENQAKLLQELTSQIPGPGKDRDSFLKALNNLLGAQAKLEFQKDKDKEILVVTNNGAQIKIPVNKG